MISFRVTHSQLPVQTEVRFSSGATVSSVKDRLFPIAGTRPDDMVLQLKGANGEILHTLEPNNAILASFHVFEGCGIHIIDHNPSANIAASFMQSGDTLCPPELAFKLSEDEYDKRPGIVHE